MALCTQQKALEMRPSKAMNATTALPFCIAAVRIRWQKSAQSNTFTHTHTPIYRSNIWPLHAIQYILSAHIFYHHQQGASTVQAALPSNSPYIRRKTLLKYLHPCLRTPPQSCADDRQLIPRPPSIFACHRRQTAHKTRLSHITLHCKPSAQSQTHKTD